jgi:raffinose/stachyose/melibiose transport system substrate-binding protein
MSLISVPVFSAGQQESGPAKAELVYWSMWNETEPQAMVLKDAIREFEKSNPNVKVTIQWNGREIRKTLQPALDAGTTIDMWDEDLERIVKTWQSYALKLDDYYTKSYPSTNGKAFDATVMKSLQNHLRTLSTDQGLYAVPYQPYVVSVFYNKDHFTKAGITSTPNSWEEFLSACGKLKAAGFTPVTIDDAYMDLPLGMHLNRKLGNPEAVEALVKDRTGKLWDDPRILQTAKEFEALAKAGYMSKQVATNKWPAGQQEVATDQVSIYFLNGTWLPNEVMGTTGPDFKWGQFAYPAVPGGEGTGAGTFGAQGFQINKNCAHPDEAFALAAHLTTGKWDQKLSASTYGAPMDTSMEWPVQIKESEPIFASLKSFVPWSGGLAADTDAFPVIKAEYTKLLAGQVSAEEFIAHIKSTLK